jgi:hypothetical protein
MARPKLFIGSSQKNEGVAGALADALEQTAEVRVWNEGVFGLNQGFLETLLRLLEEYDFAVFVLASDDLTTSGDESRPSPRDNVLFETGLFMGVLGRDRVFVVCDAAVKLKIPSDLAGLTLASYDGSRIAEAPKAAVRSAGLKINEAISAARFPHLVGDWKSVYPLPFVDGSPLVDEVIEVRPGRTGLTFATKSSSLDDFYTASASLVLERQIIGKWKSKTGTNDMEGAFLLTVAPTSDVMYGYYTTPDVTGAVVFSSWVMAKMTGADEATVNERLKRGRDRLGRTTITNPGG